MKNRSLPHGCLFGVAILTFIILPRPLYHGSFLTGSGISERIIITGHRFHAGGPDVRGEHLLAKVSFIEKRFEASNQNQSSAVITVASIKPRSNVGSHDSPDDTSDETRNQAQNDWMVQHYWTYVLPLFFLFALALAFVLGYVAEFIYLLSHGYLGDLIPWKVLRFLHVPRSYWDWLGPPYESIELRANRSNY